jgi:hypothetical protein
VRLLILEKIANIPVARPGCFVFCVFLHRNRLHQKHGLTWLPAMRNVLPDSGGDRIE